MDLNFDLSPLWALIVTWQNVVTMLACGALMELFKRGPLTKDFATTKWGQVLQYYAPTMWCWLALFLPIGLSSTVQSLGEKIMLGIVLGALTSTIYELVFKAAKRLLGGNGRTSLPPPIPLPEEKK